MKIFPFFSFCLCLAPAVVVVVVMLFFYRKIYAWIKNHCRSSGFFRSIARFRLSIFHFNRRWTLFFNTHTNINEAWYHSMYLIDFFKRCCRFTELFTRATSQTWDSSIYGHKLNELRNTKKKSLKSSYVSWPDHKQ